MICPAPTMPILNSPEAHVPDRPFVPSGGTAGDSVALGRGLAARGPDSPDCTRFRVSESKLSIFFSLLIGSVPKPGTRD